MRTRKKQLLLISLALLLLLSPLAHAQQITESLPFETLEKFAFSGHRENKNYLITNRADWQALWRTIHANDAVLRPLPEVDFSRHMVVAVFLGERVSGGFDISITGVSVNGKSLVINVKEVSPDSNCATNPVVVQPYHLIVTEKLKKKLRRNATFEVEQQTAKCSQD